MSSLKDVVSKLEQHAILKYAGSWDNVGLLVEPSTNTNIKKIMLTIDLTEPVFSEAVDKGANMIICYHPVIFHAIKKLNTSSKESRIMIKAIEKQIAIWSPHSALDAITGGINDWILQGVVKPDSPLSFESVTPYKGENNLSKVVVFIPMSMDIVQFLQQVSTIPGCGTIGNYTQCSFSTKGNGTFMGNDESNPTIGKKNNLEDVEERKFEIVCPKSQLPQLITLIKKVHVYETPAFDIFPLENVALKSGPGEGRLVKLHEKSPLMEIIERVKKHFNLRTVRLAYPTKYANQSEVQISSIAVCAGSGGSVLKGVKADLFITGELSHHEILAAIANNTSVILTEHTNCERGYLTVYKQILAKMLNENIDIMVSETDKDPINVV